MGTNLETKRVQGRSPAQRTASILDHGGQECTASSGETMTHVHIANSNNITSPKSQTVAMIPKLPPPAPTHEQNSPPGVGDLAQR
ncbi:rCG47726 [Rattus norvegicus]|uniref:RCG47726 n=1 Tax=Rattus norvegicus TaxID=10116 RepID=A6HY72_RAT|nr:rCG47726 [Rattus norvegicus]